MLFDYRMNSIHFPVDFTSIQERIASIEPTSYSHTRNFIDGAVTYLSPYLSRGLISTRQIAESFRLRGFNFSQTETLLKELCWRDYFQRVGQHCDLNEDLRSKQCPVTNYEIPLSIVHHNSGIKAVDEAIEKFYQSGYLHNHHRMYIASFACNLALSHWKNPAQWMYYHLLDGDWASNACSWQWVAGSFSAKKYLANQENINKYTRSQQTNSFLDTSYEELARMATPEPFKITIKFKETTPLPDQPPVKTDPSLPVFIYNYYNLDPLWHAGEKGNRILLLEPDFFREYPVSPKCIEFVLALSKNISDIQIYCGSFESLFLRLPSSVFHYKEHPLNRGYRGIEESREWICPEVDGYYPSFFAYLKQVEKKIRY